MKRIIFLLLVLFWIHAGIAQDISQHISYYRIYEYLDELANDGHIELNSAIKPYSRDFIADKLVEVMHSEAYQDPTYQQMSRRQQEELRFYLNEFALERHVLPTSKLTFVQNNQSNAAFIQPAYHYKDSMFRARITPLLGMHYISNQQGITDKRWYGAEFQGMIGKNFSIYGSLRDISHTGTDLLSKPSFLTREPGYEYTVGADYSDSRGGFKFANKFISIGLTKDNISWGDNYNGANIISGRAPSFPMFNLKLQPANWFELNYFHGWLVSNVFDSTYYYLVNEEKVFYRPANKYMAANMLTFTPVKHLKLSVGNSIVYAERNIHPAYFIPIAFYKSIDHALTKGLGTENQNSQLFFNFSSRNIKHLHVYSSIFFDEVSFSRFEPDSPDRNPSSLKIGANVSNFPLRDVSATIEYTRTNIINYKHSIPNITYASNSYNLGHYLGDNAREIYAAITYKPIRGMDLKLTYLKAEHGNEYEYFHRGTYRGLTGDIIDIISNPSPGDVIWSNESIGLNTTYEIFQNGYAVLNLVYSNIQGFEAESEVAFGEIRMTAEEALQYYSPSLLHGKNVTLTIGFSFGF